MTAPLKRQRRADATPGGGVVDLLVDILFGQPRLPGATCRQHVGLFDAAADGDREAAQEAAEICRGCPVVGICREWAEHAYPRRRPGGVIGAVYTPPPTQRKARPA